MQEQREELTIREWLAIIMRCKERATAQGVGELFGQSEERGSGLTLSRFKQRLEERKKLASEASTRGVRRQRAPTVAKRTLLVLTTCHRQGRVGNTASTSSET